MLDTLLSRPGSVGGSCLDALARGLIRFGVSANALTGAALALGLAGAVLFHVDRPWLALGALGVSGLFDAVDGRVARLGRGPSPWGGVLDLTSDRVVEAAVLLGIAWSRPERHLAALVLACSWYVNLCVFLAVGAASRAERPGKVIDYPPGLLERSELLLLVLVVVAAPPAAPVAAYVYAALVLVTAAQRLRYGRRALSGPRSRGEPPP